MTVADQPWVDELVAHLDAGRPLFIACKLLGMHVRTIQRAVLRDPELAAKLRAADGRRSAELWDKLDQLESYPGEWKKTAWKLEKTNPELREIKDFGAQVDQAVMAFVDRLIDLLPPEVGNQVLDAVAELERQQAVVPVLVAEADGKST